MNNALTAILAVWSAIAGWFQETFPTVGEIFYNSETGLTFFGILASGSLAVGIILLLIGVVTSLIKFRS